MSYTPEQFNRLPKWAQAEISGQARHVENLKAQIDRLNHAHPDSNVKVDYFDVHGDYGLGPNSQVDFYLGDGPRLKFRDMVTVNHLSTKGNKVLRVSTTGVLVIKPISGNVIEVTTEGY